MRVRGAPNWTCTSRAGSILAEMVQHTLRRNLSMSKTSKSERTPAKNADWRPWGYGDDEGVPPVDQGTLDEVAGILGVADQVQKSHLKDRLRAVKIRYWRLHRNFGQPEEKWRREKIKAIQSATEKLLSRIRDSEGTQLTFFRHHVKDRLGRGLLGNTFSLDPPTIEQILEDFKGACASYCDTERGGTREKKNAGAREKTHVKRAATELVEIWTQFTGKNFSLSLDTEVSNVVEFVYPGPRFVQAVFKDIDPGIDVGAITSALKAVPADARIPTKSPGHSEIVSPEGEGSDQGDTEAEDLRGVDALSQDDEDPS
jgi:hypothetical protein